MNSVRTKLGEASYGSTLPSLPGLTDGAKNSTFTDRPPSASRSSACFIVGCGASGAVSGIVGRVSVALGPALTVVCGETGPLVVKRSVVAMTRPILSPAWSRR